VSNPNYKFR